MANSTHNDKDRQQHPQGQTAAQQQAQEAGSVPRGHIANPAEPYATTEVPGERASAEVFAKARATGSTDYPKIRYHPVHGGVTVNSAEEESGLVPKTDWFDSAELADAARTWTEAEAVRVHNQQEKLKVLLEAGYPVVRNSVQSDESIRLAQPEPL